MKRTLEKGVGQLIVKGRRYQAALDRGPLRGRQLWGRESWGGALRAPPQVVLFHAYWREHLGTRLIAPV